MPSSTVENYLKQIYLLQEENPEPRVPMGRLAQAVGVVPGTATTMVKSLAEAGLVVYEPRTGVRLAPGGERLALSVIRRHRLVELFLVRVLGMDWALVHDEAERWEHVISDEALQAIDRVLQHPLSDPHGDPIPPQRGRPAATEMVPLPLAPVDQGLRIARIKDQEPAFLQFVQRHGLVPGAVVHLTHADAQAQSVTLRGPGEAPLTLGWSAAAKIEVRLVE